jgi:ABC-type uncharacterized transport system permease subunit
VETSKTLNCSYDFSQCYPTQSRLGVGRSCDLCGISSFRLAAGRQNDPVRGLAGLAFAWHFAGLEPAGARVTAWLIAVVYAVESHIYPALKTRWTLSFLGAAAVLLALVFPGNRLHATASPWLPLHWALGIASYGLFGVAVIHAWFMNRAENQIRHASESHSGMPLLTMERLTFRFVGAGFILLSATLLVGLFFGKSLYGPAAPIHWDHKTVFSLLSWLCFALLLIGRARFGWRGKRAMRILYVGSGLLLLAYVGSRFVMEIILGVST